MGATFSAPSRRCIFGRIQRSGCGRLRPVSKNMGYRHGHQCKRERSQVSCRQEYINRSLFDWNQSSLSKMAALLNIVSKKGGLLTWAKSPQTTHIYRSPQIGTLAMLKDQLVDLSPFY